MATKSLARGMGTFFKDCEHPSSRWSKCPHDYKIRYRNAAGKQTEESGFTTQDKAIARLTEVYAAKKAAQHNQSKAERIRKYGAMRFEDYTAQWREGQRHLAAASMRHLDSLLEHHLFPALASRRMNSFDHKVVDSFIQAMEREGAGLATQSNAFQQLKAILLDAHRLGIFSENPLEGVKPPQYDPSKAVIPSKEQLREIRTAGDDTFRLITDLMSGCGMRNGEAAAVNTNNIVANDTYRISEQVNQTTKQYARLKHRKPGEYRDVPLPARVKETIEWYADKYGTVEGYLLRHPKDPSKTFPEYYISNQWRSIKKAGEVDIPEGMVIYGFRHFFASNCLTNGIPITDVAEWMGHKSLDITFKIYRHLMPGSIGKAAKILDLGLAA
ncbi:tyrosine-type recombinase/integrase [Streptomyces sp. RPT161]|uniref:tyrosine-type recombinase/integrase n=1 Tax=Streptomyces sp. RPT161 TaxID=3015993 RepID=UPI0022B8A7E9|nr:tyrosine-type recombinase/integrase [Streptomyces sp. RPT161]